jgi:hypothetical protein
LHITLHWKMPVVWLWGPGEEPLVRSIHNNLLNSLSSNGASFSLSHFPALLTLQETAEL